MYLYLSRVATGSLVLLAAAVAYPLPRVAGDTPSAPVKPGAGIRYNRDIRPILADNCFACHGPDSAARKADLRLDLRDEAIAVGAIVPGKPAESLLIERVCTTEPRDLMPPPKTLKVLTAGQKDLLKRWVAAGAEYEPHWSFITPTRPPVPAFTDPAAKAWVRNPIDAFILDKLRANGLEPAPEADRHTLARRLAFDLTGLPPDPADVEAFVNDSSPDFYEKYVEKLMATPHWGEHRGRYWLDVARYADTHGIHFDNYREIWAYRDWVIRAFNANLPFDQFTVEQLAGDLLPEPTLDQRVATGFIRCNITTNEGGIIDEEYAVLYARDRTETVSQAWMGLTTGCAVCHDHKFDPVTQKDFYSLSAFFNNLDMRVRDGNISNPPPTVTVPRGEDRDRFALLKEELHAAKARLDSRTNTAKADYAKWLATADPKAYANQTPTAGLVFHAPLTEGVGNGIGYTAAGKANTLAFGSGYEWSVPRPGRGTAFTIKPGDAIALPDVGDFDRTQPFAVSVWVNPGTKGKTGSIVARMDEGNGHRGWDVWLQADRVGMHVINTYPQNALKVVAKPALPPRKWTHVTVTYDGTATPDGLKVYYDGEPQPTTVEANTLKATTRTKVPFKIGQRNTTSRANGVAIEDVRIYSRELTAIDARQIAGSQQLAEVLSKPAAKRTPKETADLYDWWLLTQDAEYQKFAKTYRELQAEEVAIHGRGTIAHIAVEQPTPAEAFVLFRGEYDQRRDKVTPATPKSLPAYPAGLPRNRLGFARWLLRPEHPLTARVTVNRFWQQVFGTGLVLSSGDFGITGSLPSHPELLDWLAIEFRERDWDVKQFFKLLVTSAAYRQAAVTTPEKLEKDEDNRLLSRGPRFRMDAEMIRDNALAASGLLVRTIGGPSVKPYQPPGVWEAVAMIGSNTRNYQRDNGEDLYRRSMYTFWKRSAPPASMDVLNAPNRETCTVRRERTNTPIQALVTLNDVQFVEAARVLAGKALAASADTDARIDFVSMRLLARSFRPEERGIVRDSLMALLAEYKANPAAAKELIAFGESKADAALDPAELAAWTMLVNQVMNLDEVLNK